MRACITILVLIVCVSQYVFASDSLNLHESEVNKALRRFVRGSPSEASERLKGRREIQNVVEIRDGVLYHKGKPLEKPIPGHIEKSPRSPIHVSGEIPHFRDIDESENIIFTSSKTMVSKDDSMFELSSAPGAEDPVEYMHYYDAGDGPVTLSTTTGPFTLFPTSTELSSDASYMFVIQHKTQPSYTTSWNFNLVNDIVNPMADLRQNIHYIFAAYGYDYVTFMTNTDGTVDYIPYTGVASTFVTSGLTDVNNNANRITSSFNVMTNQTLANLWKPQIHFVTDNVLAGQSWLSRKLLNSPYLGTYLVDLRIVTSAFVPNTIKMRVFEGYAPSGTWLRQPFPDTPMDAISYLSGIQLALYGNGCGKNPSQSVNGRIAIIQSQTSCTIVSQINNAKAKGAVGAIVIAVNGQAVGAMACSSGCTGLTGFSAVMVSYEQGNSLKSMFQSSMPTAIFNVQKVWRPPTYFAIDRANPGQARMFGNGVRVNTALVNVKDEFKLYHYYETELRRRKASLGETLEIPLFYQLQPQTTREAIITLPPTSTLMQYDTMHVEFALNCWNGDNYFCTKWDYLIRLYVVNTDLTNIHAGNGGLIEIGRWISSYSLPSWSLTNITTTMAALIKGGNTQFVTKVDGWLDSFMDVKLILSKSWTAPDAAPDAMAKAVTPIAVTPLFEGGWFRLDYNYVRLRDLSLKIRGLFANSTALPNMHQEVGVLAYPVVAKAEIYSYTTGHGWGRDQANCAEFCNHDHHFYVSGSSQKTFDLSFPIAGTQNGCKDQIPNGVPPNQYGTYNYGRAGWCPGLDVKPWVMDITNQLLQTSMTGNSTNERFTGIPLTYPDTLPENLPRGVTLGDKSFNVSYRGYFNGLDYQPVADPTPDPNGFAAQMQHISYVVLYSPTYQP